MRGRQVDLDDLAAGAGARVGEADPDRVAGDLQGVIRPVGVAESVPEGVGGGHGVLLVRPVADEEPLAVFQAPLGRDDLGDGRVREPRGPGGGQPPARLRVAEEYVGQRGPALLPGEPGQQDGGHVLAPRELHRGARVDDDHRVRVDGGDGAHQVVLAAGEGEVLPVETLGLHALGGGDDHDGGVGLARGGHGLGDQLVGVAPRAEVEQREHDRPERQRGHVGDLEGQ